MPGTDFALRNQDYARQLAAKPAVPAATTASDTESGFGFGDFLDIINPLQHIPVVSTIYRHLTGDTIGMPEKIAGDALYGGLTGFLLSVGDALFSEVTGKDVGDTVYAALIGDDAPQTAVAANDNAPPTAALDAAPIGAIERLSIPASPLQVSSAYRASGRLLSAY